MTYARVIALVVIVLNTLPVRAGLSLDVEERLLKIHVLRCEVATPANLKRALKHGFDYELAVPGERVPKGLMIHARVSHIRRIWWQQLASMMLGRAEPPRVSEWQALRPPVESDFFYISGVATCEPFVRRGTWFVSSLDDDGCDTSPPTGMCVFDDEKLVRYVPDESRKFLEPAP